MIFFLESFTSFFNLENFASGQNEKNPLIWLVSWAGGILPSCPPADNSEFVTSKADNSFSKNKFKKKVICRPGGPYWEKLYPRSLYGPRSLASVFMIDLGHCFSQYGLPDRQITYIYWSNCQIFVILENFYDCLMWK